jgi:hypothetical protein
MQQTRCLECGAETPAAAQVCAQCGAPIISQRPVAAEAATDGPGGAIGTVPTPPSEILQDATADQGAERGRPSWGVLGLVGLGLAALAAVIVVIATTNSPTSSTSPASPASSTNTSASTAPTGPLTGAELLWLQAVDREQSKINNALGKLPTTPTKAQMLELASVLRGCTTTMTRLGRPTDPRLLPVFEPMMKACAQFAKAAKCQTTLAVSNDFAKINRAASCMSATTSTGGMEMVTAEEANLQLQHPSG